MKILFHTIAIEPARWTPQRVSRPLADLLPRIAETGFDQIEIFEPHLTAETVSSEIKSDIERSGLKPVVLSSYLSLNPAETSDSDLDAKLDQMAARVEFYGFEKVRLFPGPRMNPSDPAGVAVFVQRLKRLLDRVPSAEILLETHDGSLADIPQVVTEIVETVANPRVGLLFQPTFFQNQEEIHAQFQIEKSRIRHIHLQNRMPDLSFVAMRDGIIPWPELLVQLDKNIDATLEFVPVGICTPDQFDLDASLKQARSEADYVLSLVNGK